MTTGRATVCACIIARDEEQRLPAALASVAFCDEIVVVDSGSRDRTLELARAAGARVIEHPWSGFGAQRNVAIDATGADWILEVDADERITPRLAAEIEAFLAGPPEGVDICAVPCRDLFLGGRLGPSAKYPKYRLRLFRRGAYRHDEQLAVHEGLWAFGRTWAFEGDLQHVLADTLPEAIRDAAAYARLEAQQLDGQPSAGGLLRGVVVRPVAKFGYRLVVDGGWRDGWRGFAKIGLDCWADALVWVYARREPGAASAPAHYAQVRVRRGPVRLLAIASGAEGSARAAGWLRAARAAGADVALVTDAPAAADGDLHVRPLARLTPLRLIRALDAEVQLRGVDAFVPCGPRERRLARLLPPELRAPFGALHPDTDPAEAERLVRGGHAVTLEGRDIVCLGFGEWDAELWTNQQHLMARLARSNRVLFLESLGLRQPRLAGRDLRRMARRVERAAAGPRAVDGLHVMSPLVIPIHGRPRIRTLNAKLLRAQVGRAARSLGFERPLLWSYVPQADWLVETLRPSAIVYHCVDDIAAQKGVAAAALRGAEAHFAAQADLVLASAPALAERMRTLNDRVFYAPNVADTDRFATALEVGPTDAAMAALPGPRIVFTGAVVATKLDLELLEGVARARPNWSIALVGPIGAGDPRTDISALRQLPNVHLLGARPYAALPEVLRGADAALVPYAINDLTRSVFPMKVYEYLAAGLPVVTTPLPALAQTTGVVVAADAQATVAAVERALAEDGPAARRARSAAVQGNSWDARLSEIDAYLSGLARA